MSDVRARGATTARPTHDEKDGKRTKVAADEARGVEVEDRRTRDQVADDTAYERTDDTDERGSDETHRLAARRVERHVGHCPHHDQ